jgi:hypothetical protein
MGLELPSVFLQHGTSRGPLTLKRTPTYLRFVMRGVNWDTLDALDQLDDTPADDERVLAAVVRDRNMVHLDGTDKRGRRCAWWIPSYTYVLVQPQPPDDTMRDTAKWRAWCLEQQRKARLLG